MDWLQVISIIVGSSVLSTLINIWYSARQKDNEREKLYQPLRFYLMLINHNSKLGAKLLESRQKMDKQLNYSDPDNKRRKKYGEDNEILLNDRWNYIKKILQLLEQNPQYIKRRHLPLINELFESYFLRKYVLGEKTPKDNWDVYDENIFGKGDGSEFIKKLDELSKIVN